MTEHTRRTVLTVAAASTITVAAAGCLGDDDDSDDGENGDDDGEETFEISPDDDLVLEGYSSHWEGVEPESIEGEENPTLVLEEGEEYTMEWVNGEDIAHDLAIWDEGEEVVDELITEETSTEGESAELEFEADPEMVTYVCTLHAMNQIGDLEVE